ncbi:MAG TPA: glutamate--tRNA ligase [Nitrospirota bacterium]|nr:glutamate--tRNA ligase [Nitrospirota bacterium]
MDKVRVRFAPSPTGYLHIGGVRTALFNWLFARRSGGTFILRIEDTDQTRSTDESIKAILEGMEWCGMDYDEGPGIGGPHGPYRQTERLPIYREHVERLLENGRAYRCYCAPGELEERRQAALAAGRPPKYDGRCRDLKAAPEGREAVIRFRANEEGKTVVKDLIKGEVTFDNSVLDDLIIMRTDGWPTYNFAVVVDDATMGITHVLRGDDHLNNTPRQMQMYEALGYGLPQFGHLSMILGPDKARLSKRHGATSIMQYKEMGYLPEAMVNYLVRLGWSSGDQEIFSVAEMVEKFSLDNISTSAAVFNPDKLKWLNHHYINAKPASEIAAELPYYLELAGVAPPGDARLGFYDPARLEKIVLAQREKSYTLADMAESSGYFFVEDVELDPKSAEKFLTPEIKPVLTRLYALLETLDDFSHGPLEAVFHTVMEETGLKMGKVAQPVRVALTGGTVSPGIYDTLEIIGRELSLKRLRKAIEGIQKQP